jgi:Mrp family chromosome partitioning ATPase
MNTLDKAFIKAFAKDGSPTTVRPASTAVERPQPPVAHVESRALQLDEDSAHGMRLRLDRPTYDMPVLQATHMNLPVVEHVESYELADIAVATLPQVVVEDRLQGLDALTKPTSRQAKSNRDGQGTAPTKTPPPPQFERVVAWASPDLVRPELMQITSDHLNWAHAGALQKVATNVELGWHTPSVAVPAAPAARMPQAVEARQPEPVTPEPKAPQVETAELNVALPITSPPPLIVIEPPSQTSVDSTDRTTPDEAAAADRGLTAAETALLLDGVPEPAAASFVPAWEVDAFRWPELCTELDLASGAKLSQSGEELHTASQDGLRVVAIVGTAREEGRSTLAMALAKSAAMSGCRVALLDADSANPELARRLGLESPCDWLDAFAHAAPLSEAAVASIADGVTLFPLTGPHDALSARLDDPTLSDTVQRLKAHFDLIVVDTQPLQLNAARVPAVPLPCEVDLAVLVRNTQTSSMDDCLRAATHVRSMGVRAIGIAENFGGRV